MTAATNPSVGAARRAERGRRRLAVLALAVLAGLATWAVAVLLLGVPLAARTGPTVTAIGPVSVTVVAAVVGGAGWLARAMLERVTVHARRVWTVLASMVLVLSLLGPLTGVGGAAIGSLVALHLVVGLTILLGLRGRG